MNGKLTRLQSLNELFFIVKGILENGKLDSRLLDFGPVSERKSEAAAYKEKEGAWESVHDELAPFVLLLPSPLLFPSSNSPSVVVENGEFDRLN